MLNWAARYYPLLRVLRQHNLLTQGSLLEIGCGPFGVGPYRKIPFTGCDLSFSVPPQWPMTQLAASAADLPLADNSFDVVLASDMLEHIPPDLRPKVIAESLRVASKLVIFGFPCGPLAHTSDAELKEYYLGKKVPVPEWLEEHMLAIFPESDLFRNLPGWTVTEFGNESIAFHKWMMHWEFHLNFVRASRILMRYFPSLLEGFLRRADSAPYYRKIFVMTANRDNG
ncbi:MAG: class I SAM-dependent methyltransferase [Acidobacteriaceae bacterium]